MSKSNRRKPGAARRVTFSDPRVILALGVAIIGVALVLIYITRDTSASGGAFVASEYDFELPGLDGPIALADFRGQYVLVNFWATWCPPCREEMPALQAFHNTYQDQGFTLLAVNESEDSATVRSFITSAGFSFPVALDGAGVVMSQYGTESLPTSYLIGPDGKLVKTWQPGALTRATLERDVASRLSG